MPRKVRELTADPEKAGFVNRGGRGNHRNFIHEESQQKVTLSGVGKAPTPSITKKGSKNQDRAVPEAMKKKTDIYHRWVAWSEEDQVYIGHCPDLFGGGVHGDDPVEVARELQEAIDEWEEIHEQDKIPFPPARVRPMIECA